ncbi:MAG: porU, partial [Candidatus Krumholzibacteriota bacterium]|nr:porU [Candidatus Krumholzibacteriota bacterium]
VAIPAEASFRATAVGGEWTDRRGGLPPVVVSKDPPELFPPVTPAPGFYPPAPVVVSEPFTFRRTRVIAVDCFASQVDAEAQSERKWSGYEVEISYTPAAAYAPRSNADPLVARMVVNDKIFPVSRRPGGGEGRDEGLFRGSAAGISDPHFSLSPNWVRITVDSAGVYAIDGDDLSRAGVSLSSIVDPSSFRLFSHGGVELERRDASGNPFTDADGTWRPGQWMTECDILVEYGGDGTFDPADRVLFYGVGAYGWRDLYEPGAARHEYHDHPYAKENAYYLTWDDDPGFSGSPARMASAGAAPLPSEPDVTVFEDRVFFERNQLEALSYGGDGWLWLEVTPKSGSETVTLPQFQIADLVSSRPQRFRTLALAPIKSNEVNWNHHAVYIMNGAQIGDIVFQSYARYDSARVFDTTGSFLQEGLNTFRLGVPRDLNARDFMYFDQYAVFYGRRLEARGGRLFFAAPDTSGTVNFRVSDFAGGEPAYVFDVTDMFKPRVLTGLDQADAGGRRTVRFAQTVGATPPRFWAGSSSALEKPVRIERYAPRDLRVVTAPPHMIILCHPSFRSAAERMKNHREEHYPLDYDPTIEVVTTRDVFDNFSGGLVDPMGIRNYCKFLFDNATDDGGNPSLAFLLLIGDANIDFKNYITSQENLVTTNLNLNASSLDAYATDDWFAELEPRTPNGASLLQIAVGRLPAGTTADASFLVDRVIDYETEADFGPWRDRVILVADDEVTPNRPAETSFTWDSESIAIAYMSAFLEPEKIYLTEYPRIGSIKPTSRLEFLERWNEGALAINYIGHGSSVQMADEQVFLGTDVANLRNGLRLPAFLAFSCTIGDFGRAQAASLAEKLLLWPSGGAVAAVTASEVSYIGPNTTLNSLVFQEITPRTQGVPLPIGEALLRAKTGVITPLGPGSYQLPEENNQKYNLLGDPSMPLASPRREVAFVAEDVDTLLAGKRVTIRGTVMKRGAPDTGFHGTVDLVLREPDDASGYTSDDGQTTITYRYPGGTIYRGTAQVAAGAFEFSVKIPRFVGTGPLAFLRAYADNDLIDAAERK